MGGTGIRLLLIFLSFFVMSVNPIAAATVSILVIEVGATENTGVAAIWETGMMDVLFDMGHIVSNAPTMRISNFDNEEMPLEARRDFEDAEQSGVDYFIIAQLGYLKAEKSGAKRPDQISLNLYKIRPYSVLYTSKYEADTGTPLVEEISNAQKAARTLAPYIRGAW
jgi:hypothetical protein